jgi:small subunit ribosomal protein S9
MNTLLLKICHIGRRKTSTASINLIPNSDISQVSLLDVNGKKGQAYFQSNLFYLNQINAPLKKLNLLNHYHISAKVKGGGLTSQAEAIQLGVARALSNLDSKSFRLPLKVEGFLSRDARIKERRKYGLKKARKASQSSKR